MKTTILFIINPISGTRSKNAIPKAIERYLDHDRFEHTITFTEHAGHAATLAAEAAAQGINIVAAVGGDGTINEVAGAVVHTPTALAIIPCGSGNGLARHLQIPTQPARAIAIINRYVVHTLDSGVINDRPFFCTCGLGFDAFVSLKFAQGNRRGLLQYVRNTIGVGLTYKPETYTIEVEGGTDRLEAFLIAFANASQYGNNAYIAPTASMKDGLMDVIVIRPFHTIEGAQVALQMFTKTLLSNSHVKMLQARRVHITRPRPGAVHLDGDPCIMGTDIVVELRPRSFNVVVNPDAHKPKKSFFQEFADAISRYWNNGTSEANLERQ